MLSRNEHIDYWVKSSEEDWKTVLSLFNSGRYAHSLFFAHLSLEKLCKALWVKNNNDMIPPKIHNLVKLISQSKIDINSEYLEYLVEVNRFQLEGRYPDYLNNFYKICTLEYAKSNLKNIEGIKNCLIEILQLNK